MLLSTNIWAHSRVLGHAGKRNALGAPWSSDSRDSRQETQLSKERPGTRGPNLVRGTKEGCLRSRHQGEA